jgi:biotin carboxyl carrier protein
MRYETEINGGAVSVDIEERNGHVTATVDGRTYELNVTRPEEGAYLLFDGSHVYEARVWAEGTGNLRVKLRDHIVPVKVIDRKRRQASADHGFEGRQQLTAPMPGKVVRILLAAGEDVRAGQGIIVVEAMKMQNEIKSPKDGRVAELRVAEGATVSANQVLAIVE